MPKQQPPWGIPRHFEDGMYTLFTGAETKEKADQVVGYFRTIMVDGYKFRVVEERGRFYIYTKEPSPRQL